MVSANPQLEFLVTASKPALESFELAHLNRRALLRKEAHEVLDKWADAEVEARFARWILDCRRAESPERNSLAEHSPDLLPDAPPRTLLFPSVSEIPRPQNQALASGIPQYLCRRQTPRRTATAARGGRQLALPLAFGSNSRDGLGDSECARASLRTLEHRAQRNTKESSRVRTLVPRFCAKRPFRRICGRDGFWLSNSRLATL